MTNPDKNSLPAETLHPRPGEEIPDLVTLREEKGLSLADVFAKTRISTKNLVALEQGDFAALPPSVYTRAYIQQYADLVEIDPRSLLLKYESYLKTLEDPRPARKSEDPERPPQGLRLRKVFWVVLVVLILIFAIALSFFLFSPKGKQPDRSSVESVAPTTGTQALPANTPAAESVQPAAVPKTVTPPPATPHPATPVTVTPTVQSNPLPTPQAANAPVIVAPGSQKLTIKARETTWVGVHIDQQEGQQVLLRPGDTVTYTGNQFRMDIGNAGGIDLSLQGKPLPPLGERGQVVHVTLP
jgi:cytoskeleton protein RodZ